MKHDEKSAKKKTELRAIREDRRKSSFENEIKKHNFTLAFDEEIIRHRFEIIREEI
jgi:hypothetical protein